MKKYKEVMSMIINQQTEKLYHNLHLNPGFEFDDVILKLGGNLIIRDTETHEVEVHINYRENEQDFLIIVPPNKIKNKEHLRFDIANRLGHLILHMATLDEEKGVAFDKLNESSKNKSGDILEWENEEFAASFLMPANVFTWEFGNLLASEKYENIDDIINELSEKFVVPYKSVIVKSKNLRLIRTIY